MWITSTYRPTVHGQNPAPVATCNLGGSFFSERISRNKKKQHQFQNVPNCNFNQPNVGKYFPYKAGVSGSNQQKEDKKDLFLGQYEGHPTLAILPDPDPPMLPPFSRAKCIPVTGKATLGGGKWS